MLVGVSDGLAQVIEVAVVARTSVRADVGLPFDLVVGAEGSAFLRVVVRLEVLGLLNLLALVAVVLRVLAQVVRLFLLLNVIFPGQLLNSALLHLLIEDVSFVLQ